MTIGAGTVEDKMLIRTTNREDGGKPATALATDTGPVKVEEMDNGLLTGEGEVLLHQQEDGGVMTMAHGNGGNDRTRLLPPPLQLWMTGENQNTLTSCNAGEAHPTGAHPSDVHALAEGAEEAPRHGIWKVALANILRNHKWKKGVPKRDLLTLLQYLEEDMGGEIEENTQEGENKACSLVKEAVLRQILQHTLMVHEAEMEAEVITLAEEQLDTLQALLEPVTAGEDRQPLRHTLPQHSTSTERGNAERRTVHRGTPPRHVLLIDTLTEV